MDRTSWIGLIVCLVVLFGVQLLVIDPHYRKVAEVNRAKQQAAEKAGQDGEKERETAAGSQEDRAVKTVTRPKLGESAPPVEDDSPLVLRRSPGGLGFEDVEKIIQSLPEEQLVELRNEKIIARFSTHGGTLRDVELTKHKHESGGAIDLNRVSPIGVFNVSNWFEQKVGSFELVSQQDGQVVFEKLLQNGAVLRRTYTLPEEKGTYEIHMLQVITNPTDQAITLPPYRMALGTSGKSFTGGQEYYVASAWLTANESFVKCAVTDFDQFAILGVNFRAARRVIESPEDAGYLQWVGVKNQFFTLLVCPLNKERPFLKAEARPVELLRQESGLSRPPRGVTAAAWLDGFTLAPGASQTEEFQVYAGPREYTTVLNFGQNATYILDYGMFYYFIVLLLWALRTIHDYLTGSWGWAIVVLTFVIKGAAWPLSTWANISAKKMQALQPVMKEIREKYADNPEKLNKETMQIFSKYGVNPLGGCWPMLIQIPIFISFYYMLLSAVELRGDSFLWIKDLTLPDTIGYVAGFPINPLPIIMAASQFLLMRMTPMPADNPGMQVMQFMPIFLLFILYYFAAALALYWTLSNLFSIVQTYVNLQRPIPELDSLREAQSKRKKRSGR